MSDRTTLKSFYETGDIPTEAQYADFIDSAPNITDDYADLPAFTRMATVPISSAEILNLNSAPKEIIPNPGPSKAVFVLNAGHKLTFVTTEYLTEISTGLRYGAVGGVPWRVSHGLDGVITRRIQYNRQFSDAANADIITENSNMVLFAGVANPTAGDGTLIVYAVYVILDL